MGLKNKVVNILIIFLMILDLHGDSCSILMMAAESSNPLDFLSACKSIDVLPLQKINRLMFSGFCMFGSGMTRLKSVPSTMSSSDDLASGCLRRNLGDMMMNNGEIS